jgi:hypothetical protein
MYPENYPFAFSTVELETELSISLDSAWKRMQDLGIAHYYVPGTVKTTITSKRKQGLGVVRRVYDKKGHWVEETVMRWKEAEGFLISVHRGCKKRLPMPIESLWFCYALAPCARANRCVVRLALHYRLRGGVWSAPIKPMLHALFRARLRRISNRLKIYYEIGYRAI